ncbi:MAG: hypothetical protein WA902_23475 [Thermosynechococcaceae cyanobacterium]
MAIDTYQHAIGRFETRPEAESALTNLRDSGFNMDKVSVISKGDHPSQMGGVEVSDVDGHQAKEGAKAGAKAGTTIGGALGLIGGLGVLAIPGVGSIAELGVVLANTLLGSGIGAAGGTLIGALVGWGIPEDRAKYYDERLNQGDYIILVEETEPEIQRAGTALNQRGGIYDWNVYPMAGTTASRSRTAV